MRLNEIGYMVQNVWNELPVTYSGIDIDKFIVMPNHVHGIILLRTPVGAGPRACPDDRQACPYAAYHKTNIMHAKKGTHKGVPLHCRILFIDINHLQHQNIEQG